MSSEISPSPNTIERKKGRRIGEITNIWPKQPLATATCNSVLFCTSLPARSRAAPTWYLPTHPPHDQPDTAVMLLRSTSILQEPHNLNQKRDSFSRQKDASFFSFGFPNSLCNLRISGGQKHSLTGVISAGQRFLCTTPPKHKKKKRSRTHRFLFSSNFFAFFFSIVSHLPRQGRR